MPTPPQQGDILLFQTVDDGDINVENGITEMTVGFETMAYLCLFGGNVKDDGSQNNPFTWWGNIDEPIKERRYVSETQNLIEGLSATTNNLQRIEDAVKRDLEVFLTLDIASSVEVEVALPAVNRVEIRVSIEANGEESQFTFVENWKASAPI